MRNDPERRQSSVLTWVIVSTIAVYVLQQFFENYTRQTLLMHTWFGLSIPGIRSGHLWQIITYGFLHGSLPHIVINLVGIFFIGREVLRNIGPQRFLGLYFGSIIVGGITWALVTVPTGSGISLVGASAAVFGLLVVFLLSLPDRPVTFLLFFVIPATLRPKHLALGLLGGSIFGLLFFEIPAGKGIAHSSHLGGMLAGWVYLRYLHERVGQFAQARTDVEKPVWSRKKKPAVVSSYQVDIKRPEDLKTEVDRILDKINSQGFGSLTDDERRMLDEARESLNKH
jgi:membrane associated rhomboid family serine protease